MKLRSIFPTSVRLSRHMVSCGFAAVQKQLNEVVFRVKTHGCSEKLAGAYIVFEMIEAIMCQVGH